MHPSSSQYGDATPGVAIAAIPSLPSGPADRIYSLDGQLFVAVPLARYQALMESQAHASHFPLPFPDSCAPASESSGARTWLAHASPAPTAAPCTNASISATAGPGNSRLDSPCESRTRVPVACVNCHEMRKSCDAARPCQRCIRRGLGASCIDHARETRRSSPRSQSSSGSSSTMLPSIEDNVPFVGHEDQGGSSSQNPPLFPQQYPSFFLGETASAAAASNMDMNALWSSY